MEKFQEEMIESAVELHTALEKFGSAWIRRTDLNPKMVESARLMNTTMNQLYGITPVTILMSAILTNRIQDIINEIIKMEQNNG